MNRTIIRHLQTVLDTRLIPNKVHYVIKDMIFDDLSLARNYATGWYIQECCSMQDAINEVGRNGYRNNIKGFVQDLSSSTSRETAFTWSTPTVRVPGTANPTLQLWRVFRKQQPPERFGSTERSPQDQPESQTGRHQTSPRDPQYPGGRSHVPNLHGFQIRH